MLDKPRSQLSFVRKCPFSVNSETLAIVFREETLVLSSAILWLIFCLQRDVFTSLQKHVKSQLSAGEEYEPREK